MKPVLLDTGFIVASLDRSERHHAACAQAIRSLSAPLMTCESVIAEACYLLRRVRGAPEAILENVAAGVFQIPLQLSRDATGVQRVLHKYRDHDIDLADACLIHLASEVRSGDILTLDRDFEFCRWAGNKRFRLLITLS